VNNIVTTHSAIIEENGMDIVYVRFERPNKNGFDFAEGKIPHFLFQKSYGFSEDEILYLIRYMKNNSALLWEFATKGGGENA
jgi:hypothetical protein